MPGEIEPITRGSLNMWHLDHDSHRDELDDLVRAFEQAYSRDGQAEITEFLPRRDHSLYAAVLCELIRLDLEFGWERGCPKSLEEYQRIFPELQHDRDALRAIAFEEDRLRRQAQAGPSPDRSSRREEGSFLEGKGPLSQEGARVGPDQGHPSDGWSSDGLGTVDPGDSPIR